LQTVPAAGWCFAEWLQSTSSAVDCSLIGCKGFLTGSVEVLLIGCIQFLKP
jgi:hypothetical protein